MWLFLTGPEKQDEHSTTEVTINPRIKQKFFSFLGISGLVCVLGRSWFLSFTRWIKDVRSVLSRALSLGIIDATLTASGAGVTSNFCFGASLIQEKPPVLECAQREAWRTLLGSLYSGP